MPLTVLSDSDVRTVLQSLNGEDIRDLQQSLADALHYYSTTTEDDHNGCCSSFQPMRTTLKRNDRQISLFMPASSNDGLGVKIVTLPDPSSKKSATSSDVASLSSTSTTQTSVPPSSTSTTRTNNTTPKGSLTLLDKSGAARAFINAEEITAFRTALASTMLFNKRHNVHDIVVFGAGKQAYWHIRLALLLRGSDVKHLNIINRTFETAEKLVEQLYNRPEGEEDIATTATTTSTTIPRPKIQIITPAAHEYDRLLKTTLRNSSIIFCTTPSLTPLFPANILTNPEGRKKGRYISAIGSYKPHMVEIHPDIVKQNVAPEHGNHHHRHARQGGAIVVDSLEACLKEAGEVIQAGLSARECVEIGELIMLKKDAEARRVEAEKSGKGNGDEGGIDTGGVELGEAKRSKWQFIKAAKKVSEKEVKDEGDAAHSSLTEWLHKGNVIYKSVGLGLMDVVVGTDVVRIADARGVGFRIEKF